MLSRAILSSTDRIFRRVTLSNISSLHRRIYRRTMHSISLLSRKSRRIYRRTTHSISLLSRKFRRIYRRTTHSISLPSRKFRRIYRRTTHSISLPSRMHRRTTHSISLLSRKYLRIYRRTTHNISLPSRKFRRIYRRKMQIQKFLCRRPWHKRLRYSRICRHSVLIAAIPLFPVLHSVRIAATKSIDDNLTGCFGQPVYFFTFHP